MTRKVTVYIEGREYIVEVGDLNERPVRATVNGRRILVEIHAEGGFNPCQNTPDTDPGTGTESPPTGPTGRQTQTAAPGQAPQAVTGITAPMPGDIAEIRVKPGDRVAAGDVICVLEAMKMKNLIHSPRAGTIATVEVAPGQAVAYDTVLVTFA